MIKQIVTKSKWLAGLIFLVIATFVIGGCTLANQSPVISSLTANYEGEINPEDSCQIECDASDPDGDGMAYIWLAFGGTISGTGPAVTWTAPDVPDSYTIVVEVSDDRDGIAVEQLTIEVLAPNNPPVISNLIANYEGEINPEGSCQIECAASDPDGDELTYIWSTDAGNITGEGDTVTWTAPDVPGNYTIVVEVSDGRDGIAVEQLTIEVLASNNPPVISSLITDCLRVRPSHSAIITCVASDPDGDGLTYIWTAYDGNISGGGSTVIWTAPNEYGTYTITVTVTDGEGGEVTESISIIVCGCGSAC